MLCFTNRLICRFIACEVFGFRSAVSIHCKEKIVHGVLNMELLYLSRKKNVGSNSSYLLPARMLFMGCRLGSRNIHWCPLWKWRISLHSLVSIYIHLKDLTSRLKTAGALIVLALGLRAHTLSVIPKSTRADELNSWPKSSQNGN